ncbi:hypothetical protein E2C01_059968 [Portunus trituberculatus]|uniref:Uncharacterized protein n=1 Tax=Portunus trituberculatus TaxID=210409 RepID=A0A5B7H419_PORTR|nr:hypothetical protein [Portunus trituberculatus]
MEKEAREHLIRAQIFLKNTRNRKVSKDDAADGKWQADTETEGKIEKKFTSRRELNEESDVQGCPKFERQESNFRAQTETDFHPKLDQNFPSKTEPNFHLKPDMKTEENPINHNEKTTKHDLTSQNTTPMTLQPLQRPDTDSDLDTTLSAGLDETEKVTTARPDPAVLRNPFLEMRSGHMKQVTFMGIGNKSGFKSNTLDNPKSRKKMDCVFVLREDHAGQDVRSKVMCEVEGGEKDQAIKVKRSDLNAKLLENVEKFSDFKLRRSLSELKGTDGREKGQEIKVKRSVSNPKPTEKKEKVTEIRLTEKTNTMGQESRMKRSDSTIKRDSKFKRSYLGAMRGFLRDKENQCEGPAVPNLKKPLVTQKAKGTLAGPRVLQYYNVV